MASKSIKKLHRVQKPRAGVNLTLFMPEAVMGSLQREAEKDLRTMGNAAVVLLREALRARGYASL